jgi:hypothetical protein
MEEEGKQMMEITIGSVTAIRLSEIEDYDLDEEDIAEGEEPFYRTLIIQTKTGSIEFTLESLTSDALEVIADV